LSLTLRGAQYSCWKTFKKLGTKYAKRSEASELATDLVKKASEIADRIRNLEDSAGDPAGEESLRKLFSELLYVTFVLAEQYGVNLEESFLQTIDEYILGFVK